MDLAVERIMARVQQALQTLSGYTVKRMPQYPIGADACPAIVQIDGAEEEPEPYSGQLLHTASVTLLLDARGEDIGTAINAVLRDAWAALIADRTLGGIATDVRRTYVSEPFLDREEGGPLIAMRTVEFEIDYWTDEDDPTVIAA